VIFVQLAGHGCEVILACRSESKAQAAMAEILQVHPTAKVAFIAPLDNMDFASVRAFCQTFHDKGYSRLDLLLNNAGIMAQPLIQSKDGFDVQIQTNHLSHFLLTKLLWKNLVASPGQSRVVQHSSGAHHVGGPIFDKNHISDPSYKWGLLGVNVLMIRVMLPLLGMGASDMWVRYGVSKLCNVLFMRELQRKIEAQDGLQDQIISVACHPGYANTNLQNAAHGMSNWEKYNANTAQSAADGSLPLLMAAVSPNVKNGDYIGPSNRGEMTGPPNHAKVKGNGNDAAMAQSLWEYSEECIGEKFEI
jgi:NAD(P)-dependent dehydrogenase (short-subunit alcohol dehydrogenase family)